MKRFTMKRFTALALALIMTLSLCPVTAFAEEMTYTDDQVYIAGEKTENVENDEAGVMSEPVTLSAPLAYAASTAEARWGTPFQQEGLTPSAPSYWEGVGSLEDAFDYVNNTNRHLYIQLIWDVKPSAPLVLSYTSKAILDLNGYDIDRGLTSATSNGHVIEVNGKLTLCDTSASASGKITGGYNDSFGGGVLITTGGNFTMNSGSISENIASSGGGVRIEYGANFTMNGGKISGNVAEWGGGVANFGDSFTMSGGIISGNAATKEGGGVDARYCDNVIVSGNPIIKNNAIGENENNIYLGNNRILRVGQLTPGANIGVTTANGTGIFTSGGSSYANSGYFFSDSTDYAVAADDSDLRLVVKSLSISFHANGGSGTMSKQRVAPGVKTILDTNTFVRADYFFAGWNTSADGTGESYNNSGSIVVEEDTNLYAQWEKVQVQWGVSNGTDIPSSWNRSSLTTAVARTNNLSSGTGYIQLLSDVAITEPLEFSETTILDLNGFDIDRGLTVAISNGNVITVSGDLALCDTSATAETNPGKITGGYSSGNGGGVVVNNGGTFTMTGGVVSRNAAANGGGVYNDGTFVLTGGSISGNTAETGGGLYNADGLRMTGGVITGNNATVKGGGVYRPTSYNSIYISDSPVIHGNVRNGTFDNETGLCVLGETGRADNLLITSQSVYVDGVLNEGACIGVDKELLEGESDKNAFTVAAGANGYTLTENDFAKFRSDSKFVPVFVSSKNSIQLERGAFLQGFGKIGVNQEETLTLSVIGNNLTGVEATLEYSSSYMDLVSCECAVPGWRLERIGDKVKLYGDEPLAQTRRAVLHVTFRVKGETAIGTALSATFKDITLHTENREFSAHDASWSGSAIFPPEARWGTGGEWVDAGSLSSAIDYANNLKSGTARIQLLKDVDTTTWLIFYSGTTTILDLNGKTIDRGLTVATTYGYVISVSGNLTICDTSTTDVSKQGKITGGYNRGNGGGVDVASTGTLELTGGSITGNVSTDNGGGVYVGNAIDYDISDIVGGSFTMSGGSITENHSASGGGGVCIWNYSYFEMAGGSISRNTAGGSGGGVDGNVKSTFIMTGGTISGNSSDALGGGVYFHDSFTMTGGLIVGNCAYLDGGGVYQSRTSMSVYGNPIITGNVENGVFNSETGLFEPGETGKISNVRVLSDRYINVIGHLSDTASIGGTTVIPNNQDYVTFAKGDGFSLTESDAEKFIGDSGFCAIFNGTSRTVELVESTPQTVRFDMQGHGSQIANQTIMSGSLVVEPKDPVDLGYRFCGWYEDPAYTNKWNFSTDIVKRDTVLYARWRIDQFCGEDITWEFDSSTGTLTFEGTGAMDNYTTSITKPTATVAPYAEFAALIKKVVVKKDITSIGNCAFLDFTALTSVELPSTLKTIGASAFAGCTSLTSIEIPAKVETIPTDAFANCSALRSILVDPANKNLSSVSGVLYSNYGTDDLYLVKCPEGHAGALEIAAGTVSLNTAAVANCPNLTSVSIPAAALDEITSILEDNFYGCCALTAFSVTGASGLANTSYNVVDGALYEQYRLYDANGSYTQMNCLLRVPSGYEDEFTVPATCNEIGRYAFYGCSKLSAITFDGTAPAIADRAFYGVTVDAFYLTSNYDAWNEEALQDYGGKLTWGVKCDGVTHISSTGVGWASNDEEHLQECFCGLGLASGEHEYGDDNRCDVCGYAPDGLWCANIPDYLYTGKAIKPEIEVYYRDTLLTLNKDYSISYKNNTNAAAADAVDAKGKDIAPVVIIKGKGNFAGTLNKTFTILPIDINDEQVSVFDLAALYNGKLQNPKVTVSYGTKKLGTKDFVVSYPDTDTTNGTPYLDAGIWTIQLDGTGNYTGTRYVNFTITGGQLMSKATIGKVATYEYTGEAIEPEVTVTMGKVPLVEGNDYTIEYLNNIEVGTATIVVTGMGNYAGTKTATFKINGLAISKVQVNDIPKSVMYTGEEIELEGYSLFDKVTGKFLEEGTHYTVDYDKNLNKGTATILFTGINNYTGTLKKTFKIDAYDILKNIDGRIEVEENLVASYMKGGAKPEPVITFNGEPLVAGVDYTLAYKNNTAVAVGDPGNTKAPTITITGKGNFAGKLTLNFSVEAKKLSEVELIVDDKPYTPKATGLPTVTLTDADGKKLAAGKDYDKAISYTYTSEVRLGDGTMRYAGDMVDKKDIIPVDTMLRVTVIGMGPYTGEVTTTYRIVPQSLAKATVKVANQQYTGKPIIPDKSDITVTVNKVNIDPDNFEIVSCTNNVNKGSATLTIRGVGENYGGVKTVKFKIDAKTMFWYEVRSTLFGLFS